VGDVVQDLGDTHDGDVFGADDLLLVLAGHLGAAETSERGVGQAGAEGGDKLSAVGVAGGFAGREKDERVGGGCDVSSLSSFFGGRGCR
jgi:hypothetical protein